MGDVSEFPLFDCRAILSDRKRQFIQLRNYPPAVLIFFQYPHNASFCIYSCSSKWHQVNLDGSSHRSGNVRSCLIVKGRWGFIMADHKMVQMPCILRFWWFQNLRIFCFNVLFWLSMPAKSLPFRPLSVSGHGSLNECGYVGTQIRFASGLCPFELRQSWRVPRHFRSFSPYIFRN